MHPIYGCPENFRESLDPVTATFPEIVNVGVVSPWWRGPTPTLHGGGAGSRLAAGRPTSPAPPNAI